MWNNFFFFRTFKFWETAMVGKEMKRDHDSVGERD
jgi:hypothetical protein